jgi:hypothetical protein
MIARRLYLPRPRKIAEPPAPPVEPMEPIVWHETGGWSVWHDVERYPSREFAQQIAAQTEVRR